MDLSGQTFGRLLVLRRGPTFSKSQASWHVRCECGAEKIVRQVSLRGGISKSCGCLRRELSQKRRKACLDGMVSTIFGRYKHGAQRRNQEFSLTFDGFKDLLLGRCHFCGSLPS